jgi:hypothetical protein
MHILSKGDIQCRTTRQPSENQGIAALDQVSGDGMHMLCNLQCRTTPQPSEHQGIATLDQGFGDGMHMLCNLHRIRLSHRGQLACMR